MMRLSSRVRDEVTSPSFVLSTSRMSIRTVVSISVFFPLPSNFRGRPMEASRSVPVLFLRTGTGGSDAFFSGFQDNAQLL
jgi:hypothetical protein